MFFYADYSIIKTILREDTNILRRFSFEIMFVNFEIDNRLYEKVEKYAEFFSMSKSHFMQVLVVMGISAIKSGNDVKIMSSEIGKREKEDYKETNRKLYKYSDDAKIKYIPNESEDALDDLKSKLNEKIKKLVTRCKIKLSKEIKDELDKIQKDLKNENREYSRSDIICSLIRYGINNNMKYLEDKRIWGENLIEDVTLKKAKRINIEIPTAFYKMLSERASAYDLSVSDYIKILIEEDFDKYYRGK